MTRDDVNTLERAYHVLDGLRDLPLGNAVADGLLDLLDGAALLGMGQSPVDHEPVLTHDAVDLLDVEPDELADMTPETTAEGR